MTAKDRVLTSLNHCQTDCPPCDFFATPEILQALLRHFGLTEADDLLDVFQTDIRYVNPPYIGPPLPTFEDGAVMDIWGVIRRPMPNEYGDYAEAVNLPYAGWTTIDEAQTFSWPDPDWFDYTAIPNLCREFEGRAIATGSFFVGDFINGISRGRGYEQALLGIALRDPLFVYLMDKRHRFYMEMIRRTLEAARSAIDLVLCGDDFGTQRGLLISPDDFDALFASRKKEFFDLVHSFGAKVIHHCCGSSRGLIPRFLATGMDVLQTIQTRAQGMDPYELKAQFGSRISFHGAVDVQGWLQQATTAQIEAEVIRLMEEVGRGGGYVLSPSHYIQPDTPVANVLTVYRTVARYRGGQPAY